MVWFDVGPRGTLLHKKDGTKEFVYDCHPPVVEAFKLEIMGRRGIPESHRTAAVQDFSDSPSTEQVSERIRNDIEYYCRNYAAGCSKSGCLIESYCIGHSYPNPTMTDWDRAHRLVIDSL